MRYRILKRISEAEAKHNHALQQALMKAQQVNYARQLFLNNLSHDIRTPLNVILGLGEINQKTADPEILRENQSKIRDAEEHLLAIMNNTLEMTQLERCDARTSYTGTGLGLAIVHSLIDRMHGTIHIESRENEGTRVEINLPFTVCPEQPEKAAEAAAPVTLTGRKILVVEDEVVPHEA